MTTRCIGNVLFPPLPHYSWLPLQNNHHRPIFFNNQYANTTNKKTRKRTGVLGRGGGGERFSVINLLRWQFSLEHSLGKKNGNARYFPPTYLPIKFRRKKRSPPPYPNQSPGIDTFSGKDKKRELFLKLTAHPTPQQRTLSGEK